MRDYERQPYAIVRNARFDSLTGRREPPVLDVPRDELTTGGAQQMFTRDGRCRNAKRHDVLQLITKAVGATRLIEGRPGPHTADHGLVQQPSVEKNVRGT